MVVPGIALLFAVAYFVQTRGAPSVAIYWPVITAVGLGILWGVILLKYVLPKKTSASSDLPVREDFFKAIERPGLILGASIVYLMVVPLLGFTMSNFVFMLLLFRGLGSRRWVKNIQVAIGIAAFLHLALITFMKLTLPQLNLVIFSI